MPNHPMPPPYEICAAHAERLAGLEERLRNSGTWNEDPKPTPFWRYAIKRAEMDKQRLSAPRPRTQSAKPVSNVFLGRKPDVAWLIRDRTTALNEHIMALDHQVRELEMSDRTHRQRMADLWSRQDAMREEIQAHVARIQELQEALDGVQKRLKELDVDGNGERG